MGLSEHRAVLGSQHHHAEMTLQIPESKGKFCCQENPDSLYDYLGVNKTF